MARKARPVIKIVSNGTHKGTKLFINDIEVPFEALQFVGDKNIDYDLVVGLFQSKATKNAVKQGANAQDAVGFHVPGDDDLYELIDEDDDE